MKHLEGKTVYLLPTGNNARYSKEVKKASMVKVAKVFATVVIENSSLESKLRFKDNRLSDTCNGGYVVFETLSEANNYVESGYVISRIKSKVNEFGVNPLTLLTLSQLKEIEAIIDSTKASSEDKQ